MILAPVVKNCVKLASTLTHFCSEKGQGPRRVIFCSC